MGWNPISSTILKSRLKSWRFLYAINAHIKRISFRQKTKKISKYYDSLKNPKLNNNSNKLTNWSKKSINKVFYVGTAEYQDKSGLIQGLESIFEKVYYFTKSDGSYGLEAPLNDFDPEVRERNNCRLEEQINSLDHLPDLIIGQMMGLRIDPFLLQKFRNLGIKIINISMDDSLPELWLPRSDGLRTGAIELANSVDITLTTYSNRVDWYHKEGANALSMSLAADPKIIPEEKIERDIPISFIGNCYGFRAQMIKAVQKAGLDILVFGKGWPNGFLSPTEAAKINARSKIILGSGVVSHMRDVTTLKLRDFDSMMSGGCYVTHRDHDLLRYFDEGKHLYCYSSLEELIEVLRKAIANPKETQEIGFRAQKRMISNYSWEKVWRRTFEEIGLIL